MTTPDKDLAARLAFIAASHDELQIGKTVEKAAAEMELRYHLHAAYRSNQLITTAEADARVKAAVLLEREAILAEVGIMRGVEIAGFVSSRDIDDEAIAISHGNALLALNDVCAAIRARGVTG